MSDCFSLSGYSEMEGLPGTIFDAHVFQEQENNNNNNNDINTSPTNTLAAPRQLDGG